MKYSIFLGVLITTSLVSMVSFAKRDVDMKSFNQSMQESMYHLTDENPEKFEKQNSGRFPASISPVEAENKNLENKSNKIDEIDDQAAGTKKW